MNRFVRDFLDAPLAVEWVETALRRAIRRSRTAFEMYQMTDPELADLLITRADIPRLLKEDASQRLH